MNPINARKQAVSVLEHAIEYLARYDKDGWLTNDCDCIAIYALQHAKWGLEAMDAPVTNRFWDEQRREYRRRVPRAVVSH
jgi:hypothetical protein